MLLLVRELNLGGCERDLTRLALGIDRSRFEPHVGAIRPRGLRAEELRAAGVPLIDFYFPSVKSWAFFEAGRKLRDYIADHRIELVQAWDIPTVISFSHWVRLTGRPKLITSQLSIRGEYKRWEQRVLRWTDRISHRIVVNCEAAREHLAESHGVDRRKLSLVYNGVDPRQFYPAAHAPDRSILPDELRAAEPLIGTICALRWEKDLGTLVRGFAELYQRRPSARLLIVGSGAELESLQSLAAVLGVAEAVRFEPQTSRVADWMRALDIFVISSVTESFPNGLLEAMACGCAAVGSNVGGIPEMLAGEQCGLLFEPRDTAGLAVQLQKLSEAPKLRRQMGEAAAKRARESFSSDDFVRNYEALYDDVLRK